MTAFGLFDHPAEFLSGIRHLSRMGFLGWNEELLALSK
jgi:hypothetical protein